MTWSRASQKTSGKLSLTGKRCKSSNSNNLLVIIGVMEMRPAHAGRRARPRAMPAGLARLDRSPMPAARLALMGVSGPAGRRRARVNALRSCTVALIVAGVIGIPLLAIRTFAANKSAKAADAQARTAEQGHITDRFTAAVEQLGSDKMAVRLGAIYALERISRDSRRDYWTIMETLTAYVREHAPWPQAIASPFVQLQGSSAAEPARSQVSAGHRHSSHPHCPRAPG